MVNVDSFTIIDGSAAIHSWATIDGQCRHWSKLSVITKVPGKGLRTTDLCVSSSSSSSGLHGKPGQHCGSFMLMIALSWWIVASCMRRKWRIWQCLCLCLDIFVLRQSWASALYMPPSNLAVWTPTSVLRCIKRSHVRPSCEHTGLRKLSHFRPPNVRGRWWEALMLSIYRGEVYVSTCIENAHLNG